MRQKVCCACNYNMFSYVRCIPLLILFKCLISFRNCPKAYHPSCVNRDEKFFQAKGRWNCGELHVSAQANKMKLY